MTSAPWRAGPQGTGRAAAPRTAPTAGCRPAAWRPRRRTPATAAGTSGRLQPKRGGERWIDR